MNSDNENAVIEHASSQYKLYREEVRSYLNYAAGSASLFVALVVGEISVAKDNPRLLALIPLSTLSYGAILAMIYSYAVTAARYSELLEKQLNYLLCSPIFLFENRYVGPKSGRGEFLAFGVIWACAGAMPCVMSVYAIVRLFSENLLARGLVIAVILGVLFGFIALLFAVARIIRVRIALSSQISLEWQRIKEEEPTRDLGGSVP